MRFAVWRKTRQHLEEEPRGLEEEPRGLEREYRQFIHSNFRGRAPGDEESLGTTVVLGRTNTV